MDKRIEEFIKAQGIKQTEEVGALLMTWGTRGDNAVAGMFLLLGVALRGLKLSAEQASSSYSPEEMWTKLKEEMEILWNASHEEMTSGRR